MAEKPTYIATLEFRIQASSAQEAAALLAEMKERYIFGWPCQVGLATRLIDGEAQS